MALTKVTLDGSFGKKFGKEWSLDVNSPAEALRIINANTPGVFIWLTENAKMYSHYRVICEYEGGQVEELNDKNYSLQRQLKSIRYVPIIQGAGGIFQDIVGIVMIVAGAMTLNPALAMAGASMLLSGLAQGLTPTPETPQPSAHSYYFNGAINTTSQGGPVPLIYGKCLVGSQMIAASLTISQMMGSNSAVSAPPVTTLIASGEQHTISQSSNVVTANFASKFTSNVSVTIAGGFSNQTLVPGKDYTVTAGGVYTFIYSSGAGFGGTIGSLVSSDGGFLGGYATKTIYLSYNHN